MKNIDKKIIITVLLVAFIVLIGWQTGWLQLAQVSKAFIPMPQSSAYLFIVSCIVLMLSKIDNKTQLIKYSFAVLSYLLLIISVLFLFDSLFLTGEIETLLTKKQIILGVEFTGRMSIITEILFVIQSLALILLFKKEANKKIIGWFSSIIYFTTAFILITYVENVPILYNLSIIPISILSSFSFFLFSYALLAQINFQFWPFSHVYKSSIESRLILVFIPVIVIFILIDHLIEAYFEVNDLFGPLTSSILLYIYILASVSILLLISKYFGRKI
ncbi:MAG TPA: hypothetical protein VFY09_05590, partial [Flavobacteriaceae bacterium]|nr:hypothetical protein [Flavobacteriaceae bacterium]